MVDLIDVCVILRLKCIKGGAMASFEGSIQDFHHYLGPRIRNAVNMLTRRERLSRNGICEICGKKDVLDSAHIQGKGRRSIVENVLNKYYDERCVRISDISKVENEILAAHMPISSCFIFICKECHLKYDDNGGIVNKAPGMRSISIGCENSSFKKLHKVKDWGKKPYQKNYKIIQAYRIIKKTKGKVSFSDLESECTSNESRFFVGTVSIFRNNFSSMKTDAGNSHGKVFNCHGDEVVMFDTVKSIVEAHFPSP